MVELEEVEGKNLEEEKEDRISMLPDCLVIDIISRLYYTEDVMRTCILSKRWQHLWTSLPIVFDFMYDDADTYLINKLLSVVEKVLTQCRHSNPIKFKLETWYFPMCESQLSKVIRSAISCNIQEIVLLLEALDNGEEFVLDNCDSFFINPCFTKLNLGGCMFNTSSEISWNKLKTLTISSGKLDEVTIQNILSGSPLLETFELKSCYGYKRIDITSKSVKNFVFSGYSGPEQDWSTASIIEINAPFILSLTIGSYLYLWKLLLLNVSSLVNADINYTKFDNNKIMRDEREAEMLKGFILNLRHVKELMIGSCCSQALAYLEAKGFSFPANLKKY